MILTREDIELIKSTIVKNIKPQKIFLFGSYANGNPNTDSDLDLFIVVDDNKNIFETIDEINKLFLYRESPMDFVVVTETIYKKNNANKASFYNQGIKDNKKVLYEK